MPIMLIHIVLCLLLLACDCVFGFLFKTKTTTEYPHNVTSTEIQKIVQPGEGRENDPIEREAGAIVGAVFGILLCVGFIGGIGILYIRRKRQREREYCREMKNIRSSRHSSGVYMDTATDSEMKSRDFRGGSKYSSVPTKHGNGYDDDSEDELWSASTR